MLIPVECGYVQIPLIRVAARLEPPRGNKALGVPGAGDKEGDTQGRNLRKGGIECTCNDFYAYIFILVAHFVGRSFYRRSLVLS